ncbi:helix-turn-helix transcriptional regulator [Acidaminobacter sp. JC074]|uniref:helix-turn-helix transcriptional regulator n=1 Tax=Acidaminobacter sp. JC074 TaxID=2530199 RepID=UPI001F0FA38E|nr:helix-turn-helix transcriptional regulator [Acidaminobacter sp. JC074]
METYKIDKNKLKEKIEYTGMKQSLLAHKVGVSEKTISRWVTGKVFFVKYHNLEALSHALNCHKDDLLEDRDTGLIHTLIEEELLEKLSPYDNFEMVEQIFLHAFNDRLDEKTKCRAYLVLANANWKNKKYPLALSYLDKVSKCAESLKDESIWFEYYYQLGTIESIKGEQKSYETLVKAFDLRAHARSPLLIGKLSNNLSMMYREMGDLEMALSYMEEAYRYFEIAEKYYNLSIACQGMMTIYNELKAYEQVLKYGQLGKYFSNKASYDQGYDNVLLYEILALFELDRPISDEHKAVLRKVTKGDYKDYFVLEFVFIYMIRSKMDYLDLFVMYKEHLPIFVKAMVYKEMGKKEEANEIFKALSFEKRFIN